MTEDTPSLTIPQSVVRRMTVSRREIDSVVVGGIVAVGAYVAVAMTGTVDFDVITATARKFLGVSAPLFAAAGLFLLWVIGALIVETAGLSTVRRRWGGVAAALFYLENAAPFVGLLECFLSIVKALLAYSEAGASAAAQSVLIANIAVALGASAGGCFVALCAHSLKAVLAHRMAAV
jgi:hypothetical protein